MILNKNSINLGYLFPRKDIQQAKVKQLLAELETRQLEVSLMLTAIKKIKTNQLTFFDSLVGDCKCQTRTSFILDLKKESLFEEILNESAYLEKLKQKLYNITTLIDFNNFKQIQKLTTQLINQSLFQFLEKANIIYTPNKIIKDISYCLLTKLNKKEFYQITNITISSNKFNKLTVFAKKEICKLSLQYEHALAQKFCSLDIQKSLEQVETKGICSMTSFFPSFKPIFAKMKALQETFVLKKTIFCLCGGVQKNEFEIFNSNKKKFISISLQNIDLEQPSMIIYGFQFPGSFNTLKKLLNLPAHEMSIPKHAQTSCQCPITNQFNPKIFNIEEAILANFAQHPQFTNDSQIDFEGLKLLNSELHKEYEWLKTLSGFSMSDMSKFCIDHIYPSTIQDALNNDSPSITTSKTTHIPISQPEQRLEKII